MERTQRVGGEQLDIEADGEHAYLIQIHDVDDEITIELRLGEDATRDLDVEEIHEGQVVAATVRYLLGRQEAFDLPSELDIEDIMAAYPDFTDVIRREVGALDRPDRSTR